MKAIKTIVKCYQVGTVVYYGVKAYKAHQTKAFLKDDELTERLAEVVIKKMTPILADHYGVDLSTVSYSWGEQSPVLAFEPLNAMAVTYTNPGVKGAHIHYYTDRVKETTLAKMGLLSIQDYAYAILELIAHELVHVRQHQQGINLATTSLWKTETPAYALGMMKGKQFKHEVKAILNELGL